MILHRTGALATRPFAAAAGKRLEQLTAADFQHTLGAVLVPAFVLSRAVAECMKPRGSGSVVLFSSMYGVVSPDPRIYHAPMAPNPIDYGASKAAVLQIARYFAVHTDRPASASTASLPGRSRTPACRGPTPDSSRTSTARPRSVASARTPRSSARLTPSRPNPRKIQFPVSPRPKIGFWPGREETRAMLITNV